MSDKITVKQFIESAGVEDWCLTSEGVTAFFRTRSFAESARFVQAIGALEGVEEHRPGIDIRHDGVTVRMVTYTDDHFGPGTRDVELARRISAAARDLGLAPDRSAVQSVLIIPGAPDITKVMPFWRAVLRYEPRRDSPAEDLVDPHDRTPPFWFEQMKEPRADGGGAIHLAVWLPGDQAKARIDAALAAGGRMVRDEFAPSWWTLADAAGNEVDIATATGR
jgi:4a-hydroxytetrahydrobiopterin dehydratase